jgi:hypothetical protein
MKFSKAKELGRAAGAEAVDESGLDADELLATLRPGHDSWSESAAGARAHAIDGVPDDDALRNAYYRAYDDGARLRISGLTA